MRRVRAKVVAFLLFALSASAAPGAVETYVIDPEHSSVGFGILHLFTKSPGSFTRFSGEIIVDRDHLEKNRI